MTPEFLKKKDLPDTPGVYFFMKEGTILYIGKATSLRSRVKSYFAKDLIVTRGPHILDMVTQADDVKFERTETVIEALIHEANLIKKYWPYYNTKEKDNSSFQYVAITRDEFPKVVVIRGRTLTVQAEIKKLNAKYLFGPYTSGSSLKEALRIIRRIFPYIDESSAKRDNYEFYRQLGLTPETGTEEVRKAYLANIENLKLFFQGKKKTVLRNLKKDMAQAARNLAFENADRIKRTIFALEHINDVALIKNDSVRDPWSSRYRIEAYDIAHMSGKNMVGVMVAVVDGKVAKDEYRKFSARGGSAYGGKTVLGDSKANDTAALEEILTRRFRHREWAFPDLIVVDGSTAQSNVAQAVIDRYHLKIPIVAVTKDERHVASELKGDANIVASHKNAIVLANQEAHRFAITFHKKKRGKSFLTI